MTDRIEDGGPAFPQNDLSGYGMGPAETNNGGMSLRDWFAGQVIASVRGWHPADRKGKSAAQIAYEVADAMLAARKGGAE